MYNQIGDNSMLQILLRLRGYSLPDFDDVSVSEPIATGGDYNTRLTITTQSDTSRYIDTSVYYNRANITTGLVVTVSSEDVSDYSSFCNRAAALAGLSVIGIDPRDMQKYEYTLDSSAFEDQPFDMSQAKTYTLIVRSQNFICTGMLQARLKR
jgi:hypothetical protein